MVTVVDEALKKSRDVTGGTRKQKEWRKRKQGRTGPEKNQNKTMHVKRKKTMGAAKNG